MRAAGFAKAFQNVAAHNTVWLGGDNGPLRLPEILSPKTRERERARDQKHRSTMIQALQDDLSASRPDLSWRDT